MWAARRLSLALVNTESFFEIEVAPIVSHDSNLRDSTIHGSFYFWQGTVHGSLTTHFFEFDSKEKLCRFQRRHVTSCLRARARVSKSSFIRSLPSAYDLRTPSSCCPRRQIRDHARLHTYANDFDQALFLKKESSSDVFSTVRGQLTSSPAAAEENPKTSLPKISCRIVV